MNNFTFPLGPAYNGTEYSILYTGNLVELICHFLLDCPFSALNFFLIFKTSILHPNLKVILLCQSACIFVRGIGRVFLIISRLIIDNMTSSGPLALSVLYMQATFARNFMIQFLVIERIMATFMSKNYEQWKSTWFNVLWIFIVLIITLFNASCGNLISSQFYFSFSMFIYASLIIFGILEILALIWIWKYNERIYKNKATNQKSLSERYQLAENIRTAKQMIPCISIHFFNLFDGAFILYAQFYRIFGPSLFYYDLYCSQQVFIATSIGGFLIEFSMIFFHPFLKRDFFRLLNSAFQCFAKCFQLKENAAALNRVQPADTRKFMRISIVGIRGDHLKLCQRAEEIGEEHFRQLNSAWQINKI